jgi:hypothetical protein
LNHYLINLCDCYLPKLSIVIYPFMFLQNVKGRSNSNPKQKKTKELNAVNHPIGKQIDKVNKLLPYQFT